MHKRNSFGFTIVELIVVIAAMAILLSISFNAQLRSQAQTHDSVRQAHMAVLANELEKFFAQKGAYPPGCPDTACTSILLTDNDSTSALTSLTTTSNLRTIFPTLRPDFGDPQSASASTPFMQATGTIKEYYYFGGTINARATTASQTYTATSAFPCAITSTLNPGQVGSYVIGYFDEQTHAWVLKGGRNGVDMSVTAGYTSDGCIINRG
jgi:prepilin-type N-terminal cleavage/methylation domain-containing protein